MAIVTGNYVTSSGAAIPAGVVPQIEVVPSKNAVTIDGQVVSVAAQTVPVNASTGAFSVNLIPTVDVIDRDFYYLLRGYYLDPNIYGDSGATRVDVFNLKLSVPSSGGTVDELVGGVVAPQTLTIVSLTQPAVVIPGVWWLHADPNGNPALGTGDYYEGVA